MKLRFLVTLSCAVTVFAGAAAAQEQSPENAQKFIAQIGGMGQLLFTDNYGGNDRFEQGWIEFDQRGYNFPKTIAPIWGVTSSDRCITLFMRKQAWLRGPGDYQVQEVKTDLHWNHVVSVQPQGNFVHIAFAPNQWGQAHYRFTLPNEALAKRMAYAMEFLRVSCDATQGTGF